MAKTWAMIFGWIFILAGIIGFFSNPLIGSTGYFLTDTVLNIVHLIFGIILLWAAYGMPMKSGAALKTVGVVYLVLAIIGFISGSGKLLGIATENAADNWLFLVLGIVLLVVGMMGPKKMAQQM